MVDFLWSYLFYISSIIIISSPSKSHFFLPYSFSLFWELGFLAASGSANWQKYMRKWEKT